MIDFENMEDKLANVCKSKEWMSLVKKFKKAEKIYFIGNGGLRFTAAHADTDCTRLIPQNS